MAKHSLQLEHELKGAPVWQYHSKQVTQALRDFWLKKLPKLQEMLTVQPPPLVALPGCSTCTRVVRSGDWSLTYTLLMISDGVQAPK